MNLSTFVTVPSMEFNGHFRYTRKFNEGHDTKFNLWKADPDSANPITKSVTAGHIDKNVTISKVKSGEVSEFKIDFRIIPKDENVNWPARAFSRVMPIPTKSILESPSGKLQKAGRECFAPCFRTVYATN